MFPNFYNWLEMGSPEMPQEMGMDNPQPEQSSDSVSEPQHKKGESSLTLNKLVEKRIKELIEELENRGKAKENEVLDAINYYLSKNTSQKQEPEKTTPDTPADPIGGGMPMPSGGGGMPMPSGGGGMPMPSGGGGMPMPSGGGM